MFRDGRVIVCIVAWLSTVVIASIIVQATRSINYIIFAAPAATTIALLGDFKGVNVEDDDETEAELKDDES